MSSFACYWPWLFGGAFLGWTLWQLFDRFFRRDGEAAGLRLTRELDTANTKVSSLHADLSGANGRASSIAADIERSAAALKSKTDEALHIRSELIGKTDEALMRTAELNKWMTKFAELESHGTAVGLAATAAAATAAAAAAATLKSAHDKHDALKVEFDTAFRALNGKTEELTRTSGELAEWKTKYAATESHAKATATELSDWKTKHASLDSQLRASVGELAEWKTKHATTDSQMSATAAELADWKTKHTAADTHAKSVAAQLSASTSNTTAAALAAAAAMAALHAKFDAVQAELDTVTGSLTARTADAARAGAELAEWKSKHAAAETQERAASSGRQSERAAAVTAAAAAAAALTAAHDKDAARRSEHETLISTLKSDHERTARSLHTDLESARVSLRARSDDTARLSAELADWKARYSALETQSSHSLKSANTVALAASLGFKPQKGGRDDLTIIEGIGPKINELLIAGGIDTFVKLANAPVERVQAILDAAGPSFRLAKPASWARQSELCASGEWEALKALQDALTAGVDTDKA